jgi:hypothetical protein
MFSTLDNYPSVQYIDHKLMTTKNLNDVLYTVGHTCAESNLDSSIEKTANIQQTTPYAEILMDKSIIGRNKKELGRNHDG